MAGLWSLRFVLCAKTRLEWLNEEATLFTRAIVFKMFIVILVSMLSGIDSSEFKAQNQHWSRHHATAITRHTLGPWLRHILQQNHTENPALYKWCNFQKLCTNRGRPNKSTKHDQHETSPPHLFLFFCPWKVPPGGKNVPPMSLGQRSNNMSHRIVHTCC